MSDSLVKIYLHIVFSTKNRRPFLCDQEVRARMHAYLATICNRQASPPLIVGGVEDHVHIGCRLAKTLTISELVMELKRESSKWIKQQGDNYKDFYWQTGYGAFSLSPSHVNPLIAYIKNQESHHRQITFQDEMRNLYRKYGITIDERYAWE